MSPLPRFDEMRVETLREKCRERHLDGDGAKPTLVARLATFEIEKIEADLSRSEAGAANMQLYSELSKKLQLAVAAKADQVYNVKRQYLLDEMEEIKAERDEEKREGMKRYGTAKSMTRKNGEVFAAQGKKLGFSQEGIMNEKGAVDDKSPTGNVKPKRKTPLAESTGNKVHDPKKFSNDDPSVESSSEDEDEGDGGLQYLQYLRKKAARGSVS